MEYEIGREVLDELRGTGYKDPHKEDRDTFQREVLRRQLTRERELNNLDGIVFFDRGIVDNLAYYRLDGIEPPESLKDLAINARYDKVFYLDLIPQNGLQNRNLDETERIRIGELILEEYTRYGYYITIVPYLPLDRRTNLILRGVKL